MRSRKPSRNAIRSSLKGMLLCSLIASGAAQAQDSETTWFGEVAEGEWLAGIKLGAMSPDIEGFDDTGFATFVFGYQFARPAGDRGRSSIEVELGVSDSANINATDARGIGEYDAHTLGVFFNYRSPGTVYFKGKAGILDSNIDAMYDSGLDEKYDDTAFAYGLGFGVRLGGNDSRATLEAEWMGATGDNDLQFYNLGLNIEF